jgi:hypothetical protein
MGAMAVSTLAGVRLVEEAHRVPLLTDVGPFVQGMTLLFWATATWWSPILLALGAWRHLRRRFPLSYEHGYWAAVFPLGMYTVCTQSLIRVPATVSRRHFGVFRVDRPRGLGLDVRRPVAPPRQVAERKHAAGPSHLRREVGRLSPDQPRQKGQEFVLDNESDYTLGRARECSCVLDDPLYVVARRHCRIKVHAPSVCI